MEEPKKIIVRMPNWIGDLVMATPVLALLKKHYPQAEITAMCQKPLSELLLHDPSIDEVFSYERTSNAFLRKIERKDVITRIREGEYDLGVLLTNSFSSAWWFLRGGVKKTVGFQGHFRSFLLSKAVQPSLKLHQVELYQQLLQPLKIISKDSLPRLYLEEKEKQEARELLRQRGAEKKRIVGLCPGAAFGPSKRWPEEHFEAFMQKMLQDPSICIVIVGDSAVTPFAKKVLSLCERVIDLTGVTSLRELCSIIALCDLFITNDSGPMHIAAALKVSLIALFGSTSPERTGPYKQGKVLYKKVACSPCYKRICPIDFPCMRKITPEEVYLSAKTILSSKKEPL